MSARVPSPSPCSRMRGRRPCGASPPPHALEASTLRRAVRHLRRADPCWRGSSTRWGHAGSGRTRAAAPSPPSSRPSSTSRSRARPRPRSTAAFARPWAGSTRGRRTCAAFRRGAPAAGLSRQKIGYLRDLAEKAANGLPLRRLRRLADDDVVAALVGVKGIGRWTAEMFLMFRLGRLDVLPVDDYGIRKAMQRAYRKRALPKPDWMRRTAPVGGPTGRSRAGISGAAWTHEHRPLGVRVVVRGAPPRHPHRGRERGARAGRRGGDRPLHRPLSQGADRQSRRGPDPRASSAKERWDRIVARQAAILEAIERQKKLTPELERRSSPLSTSTYSKTSTFPTSRSTRPRRTRAGGRPRAPRRLDLELRPRHGDASARPDPGPLGLHFPQPGERDHDAEAAIGGAQDILVERLAEIRTCGRGARSLLGQRGRSRGRRDKAKPNSKYENYFPTRRSRASSSPRTRTATSPCAGGSPRKSSTGPSAARPGTRPSRKPSCGPSSRGLRRARLAGRRALLRAARLAFKEHVFPSIENELHRDLKEAATTSRSAFRRERRSVLLASPFGPKPVLAVDPGLRTGCKLAVVDAREPTSRAT